MIEGMSRVRSYGRVVAAAGLVVSCEGLPRAPLGTRCRVIDVKLPNGMNGECVAEVVGHKDGHTMLMPFGNLDGIGPGCRVYPDPKPSTVRVNHSWMGRMVNALGEPVDGKGALSMVGGEDRSVRSAAPLASLRNSLGPKMDTGVRVMNTLLPLCLGQRLGIFAGSGVGKSVLMGMLAQHSTADVTVVGLVGERGREVNEFVKDILGEAGMARSVVVVATNDEPPLMRRQAALMTMAVAEYFRDCGFNVLLMMDSVTRFALAQREIGLASGEPPTTRGFTPSVFAELPKLLERAGPGVGKGSISAIFTVLVEGSDMEEPVADAVRGILDGHIVMTRALAERGHFPAIDVLQSVSRTVPQCLSDTEWNLVRRCRELLSTYDDMAELIRLGAYVKGSDPKVDEAIRLIDGVQAFLTQTPKERAGMAESFSQLQAALG
ncbi:MAG: flagellum-specific ATP synthase FliI [Alphaproteobacteria bacterium CG_4_10_14_0_8_um_filter_53_9]|nr:MAG: flagellum-specific ATP synthase FliI [Alphaproteobacteria bacterium CG_4_10_14_0_8_um_filter_53_9]